jgi:transposase
MSARALQNPTGGPRPLKRLRLGSQRRPLNRQELQRENKRLREENERLRREVAESEKKVAESEQQIADREKQIANQEKLIADLERQLAGRKKDSTNSSKPPSSDGPAAARRWKPARCRGQRKPGGQKGHPGRHRELQPLERVDETVPVLPSDCRHCGEPLPQQIGQVETQGEVHRYQVTELPPLRAHITEYQCHKVACPRCGGATRAELPAEVRVSAFGPRLAGLIAYLTVGLRIPRRGVEQLLATALGIEISVGSTQKLIEESSEALATVCQELERQLPKEPVLNSDETGWRSMGERRWLWALVASSFVFFTVAASRSSQVLIHLLGTVFPGILCSDRFGAYLKYHKGRAQFCWAHLKRDLLGIQEFARTTDADRFCRDALALVARLFRLWHRFRGGGLDRSGLILKSIPLQKRFFYLCEAHLDSKDKEVRVLATALFQHCDRLFAFLEYPGVEPTNNSAERALRHAVIWRKGSFGNQSANGEVATARLLTVARTCVIQRRNALEFLTDSVRRHRTGQPALSLLER